LKLLSFSDLHVDYNSRELKRDLTREIADCIKEFAPDRVVVAGDMAGGAERCIRYIEELQDLSGVPLSYVPGNHSIWAPYKSGDSWAQYERLRNHPSSLIDKPLVLNEEWVLIGDMGWYDYSFGLDQKTRQEIEIEKNMIWKDSVMARWGMTDEELTDKMVEKLRKQFVQFQDKKVVFANHFIPYAEYVPLSKRPEHPMGKVWNMIRPFMGSVKLGEMLDEFDHVKYVIFGHKHWRHGVEVRKGKKIVCNPLGYVKEWASGDFAREIRTSATLIEL
jgi:putative phosphoesterase